MLPVLAIVGQPNVGKSTLFNFLTKSRDALVADFPGLTRDRQYGHAEFAGQQFIAIDTGGIGVVEKEIEELMLSQAKLAIAEANCIIFMVDAKNGLTPADQKIARELRKYNKKIFLGVNKVDGLDENIALSDFYSLGFPDIFAVSATHGRGIHKLMQNVLDDFPKLEESIENKEAGIKIAIVGRPNVGKSTLVNRMLGEERVIVFDEAGTTRDSIYIPFERHNEKYTLIDTAGVRRRGRVFEAVEKFSIIKTLQAIENANVVIFIIDASENVVDQDLHLLGYILETGRALVLAVNKWDGLSEEQKEKIKNELHRRMFFVNFARLHFISALHGTNVGHLFDSVKEAYDSAQVKISSHQATEFLQDAIAEFQPPLVGGRRIKLRYAHMGGQNPPVIVIHGNQTDAIPLSYKRYLINYYRERLHLIGTPIRFEFKSSKNPFEGKKEKLSALQKYKKKINERTKRDLVIKARKKKNK